MKVLMVSKACVVGAYQTKLEALGAYQDVDLTVVVPATWREKGGDLALERSHTQGYALRVEPIVANGQHHLHFYPNLGRLMRQLRPDIVHLDEEPYSLVTWLGVRQAEAVGAKTLFFSWQNILRRYPLPFRWWEQEVLRKVKYGLMGNNEADKVWRAKGYRGPSLILPQFGVSLALFQRRSADSYLSPTADRPFVIGSASRRLNHSKGVDLILEAARQLQGPWRLLIAGDGEEREGLLRQATEWGIADNLTFVGKIGSEEMPSFLQKLDVLVLPSRTTPTWKEQFGRVLIEAMACGVPVVGSDSGEIPHVIGEAGLIFPEGSAAGLHTALQQLLNSAELAHHYAELGWQRVREHYTQHQIAGKTVATYRTMLTQ